MKTNKIKNQFALKRGTYNAVIIAIVLSIIIALNVLVTALAQRYPLQIDITATGENTLSEDNIDFLKEIDREVNVVLIANEASYASDMAEYAMNLYSVYPDQLSQSYYTQAGTLLESYEKYNENIKFRYVSPDSAAYVSLKDMVSDTTLAYGDVLIYAEVEDELGKRTNTKVINYTEMFVFDNSSGYYTVTSSDIESAVTGGIASVMITDIKNVAYYSAHSTEGMFDYLKATLSNNGFKVNEIKDTVIKEIPEDTDAVVLVGPQKDLTADELRVLDEFLDNGGKKGKNLFVFINALDTETPNLNDFLAEWGVEVESGHVLLETDEENCVYEGGASFYTAPYVFNAGTEHTKEVNANNGNYISMYNAPLKTAYQTFGNRTSYVLMNTSDTVVSVPWSEDLDDTEKPDNKYEKDSYAAAILTSETIYTDDGDANVSSVITFSSANFASGTWDAYYGCQNLNIATAIFKSTTGQTQTADIYYTPKTVSTYQFIAMPTKSETDTNLYVFIVALPLIILASGIVIWLRRKSR